MSDEVLLGEVHRAEKIPFDQRINPQAMIERIKNVGKKGWFFTCNEELGDHLGKAKHNDGEIEKFAQFARQSKLA